MPGRVALRPVGDAAGRRRRARRVLRRDVRLLLVAPLAARSRLAVAALPPDPPQPAAPRGHHVVLQASAGDGRELARRQRASLSRARIDSRGRRGLHALHGAGRILLSHELPHAALGGVRVPAAGNASHPSRARPASRQLRRRRPLGHAVRHVAQPAHVGRRLRLHRRPRGTPDRHAALPRRPSTRRARREPPPLSRRRRRGRAARRMRLLVLRRHPQRLPRGDAAAPAHARAGRRGVARARRARRVGRPLPRDRQRRFGQGHLDQSGDGAHLAAARNTCSACST